MNHGVSYPGLVTLALIYLWLGGLAIRFSLELVLASVSTARPRARWGIALAAFALAIVVPLALLTYHVAAAPPVQSLPAPEYPAAEPGLLQISPVNDGTAWLTWAALGWPAWAMGIVWVAGWCRSSLRGAVAALRLRRLRRTWSEAPAALLDALDWPEDFPLRVAENGMPLAVGGRHRAAFLPLWMLRELDTDAVRSVARHELAHLRWHDPSIDTAVRALRALFWPSLPLWSLERRIRREREAAADREAIAPSNQAALADAKKLAYAKTLARVAARQSGWTPAIGASGDLEERVRRLLGPVRRVRVAPALVAGLLLAVGAAVAYVLPIPVWHRAAIDERAGWGPLDYVLGYNPVIESTVTPDERRVWIQGYELTPREVDRWFTSLSLTEQAQMVRQAEARARQLAAPESVRSRDGP